MLSGLEQKRDRVIALEAQAALRKAHVAALQKQCTFLEEYVVYTLIGEPLGGLALVPAGEASGWLTKKGAFSRWSPRFVQLCSSGHLRFFEKEGSKKEKSNIDLALCDEIRWAATDGACAELQIVTAKDTYCIATTGTKRQMNDERASAEIWRRAIAKILSAAKARRV